MKKLTIASLLCLGFASISLTGCEQSSTVKEEHKISTPEGTTTTTNQTTVKKTGDNPPPAP